MKKGPICSSIVAIVVFCTLNVATALTGNYSTKIHGNIVTDAKIKPIMFTAPDQAKINETYDMWAWLSAGNSGKS
jgi:hypothetical protein